MHYNYHNTNFPPSADPHLYAMLAVTVGFASVPEFCNAHYCELYFSPLYKRVLLCQEIFIFVLYNLVQ